LVHSDHCSKRVLKWLDGMLEADEAFFKLHGEPLFSSHMLDLSEEELNQNVTICARYLKRMEPMKLILEMEIGVTGGAAEGVEASSATAEACKLVWDTLSPISEKFTIAAAVGNQIGVYKPGTVKLQPELLDSFQKSMEKQVGYPKPLFFAFPGGSGSEKDHLEKAVSSGAVKMSVNTDTQWAYFEGFLKFYKKNEAYLQGQIGNPEGEDKPNKDHYDSRKWVRASEESMRDRVIEGFKDLNKSLS